MTARGASARRFFPLVIVLAAAGALYAGPAAPPWVRAAAGEPLPELPTGTAAVVLLDDTKITVAFPGELTIQRRRVVKILTPAGKGYAYGGAVFDDNTKLRSLRGWSIDPSGEVTRMKERQAVESSAGDYEVFTDAKVRVLNLPAEAGSVIAYEYELRDRPYEPVAVWRFQEQIPVRRARFSLVLPVGWTFEPVWKNFEAAPPQATSSSQTEWEVRDVPAIADEPRMPAPASLAGWMGVRWGVAGTPRLTWSDVARWYGGLAATRLAATPQIQAHVRTLSEGGGDPLRAIARFAQLDVRYVAVEIGIGGYQPHASAEVFANRYGDCKDKVTLLRTMFREKGIETHYLLVNSTPGIVEPSFPTIGAFNHVIIAVRVPKERAAGLQSVLVHPTLGALVLFDPTSTTTPFGHLPRSLEGSRGLLVTNDGGELVELPVSKPESNELRRVARLKMNATGVLQGMVEETYTGALGAEMRQWLQPLNGAERVRALEGALGSHLTDYSTAGVTIDGLDDPERALAIRYELAVSRYGTRVADMILIRPRLIGRKGGEVIDVTQRKYEYVTDGVSQETDEVEIALPSTITLDELPKPVSVSTPHVAYASSSAFESGVLRYKRRYAMQARSVSREALPALNAAFARISADERATAVFK